MVNRYWVPHNVLADQSGWHQDDTCVVHEWEYDKLKADNESLRKDARLLNILVEAMAEVKATSDGESDQPIADIVSGCLDEIAAISSPENPS